MVEQQQFVRFPLATEHVWATRILLALNILVYITSLALNFLLPYLLSLPTGLSGNVFSPSSAVLFLMGWKDNEYIFVHGQYWRFLTAMFLHGGLLHILFNGFALHSLGQQTERIFGLPRFLAIYFVSGISGSVASYAFSPNPSVGASGAIFGLIGGLSVFFYTTRHMLGEGGRYQLQNMIGIILINVLIGLSAGGIIDNYAHLGGLLGGIVCGWIVVPHYVFDRRFLPPLIERHVSWVNWVGVFGLFVFLGLLVLLIKPLL